MTIFYTVASIIFTTTGSPVEVDYTCTLSPYVSNGVNIVNGSLQIVLDGIPQPNAVWYANNPATGQGIGNYDSRQVTLLASNTALAAGGHTVLVQGQCNIQIASTGIGGFEIFNTYLKVREIKK